jgi:hypothetical protein
MVSTINLHKLATELRNFKHPEFRPFLAKNETDDQIIDHWIGGASGRSGLS